MSMMMDEILEAARALPLGERRELAARLAKEVAASEIKADAVQSNLVIVERTRGTIKGLDREPSYPSPRTRSSVDINGLPGQAWGFLSQ
jgi:hypothetical protein